MTFSFRTLALAAVASAALAACHRGPDPKGAAAATATEARLVTVARVAPRLLEGGSQASGLLIAHEEAAVAPEVTGFRVARVLADVGSQVKAGQTLVVLDDTLLKSQIDQQQALVNQAEVAAKQAEAQAQRVVGLDGTGVLSQEQIDDRRFQAQSARAQAAAQTAQLRELKTRQSRMNVASPVSGVVFERNVRPGDLSGAGAQPMFRIIRDNKVELEAQVSEGEIANLKIGQPVTVTLASGHNLKGNVRLIVPAVDQQTKLGKVRVALPANGELRPGGFGRANFGSASASALTVPEAALRYDADGVTVMIVDDSNKVRKVPVRAGRHGGGFVELLQGPPAGSRVLLGAASFVLEGDTVKPQEVNDAQAAALPPTGKPGAPPVSQKAR